MTDRNRTYSKAALLKSMNHPVVVTDLQGAITEWNDPVEELFGWSREEVIGRRITEVISAAAEIRRAEELIDSLRAGSSFVGTFLGRHRSGHEMDIFMIGAPLMTRGVVIGLIGLMSRVPHARPSSAANLTRRETQVARLTAAGKSSSEIARVLGVTGRTVESHRSNIYRKLGIHSQAELVVFAVKNGLWTVTAA